MPARVLVIEDNPANLALMTYLLNSFGHRAQGVSGGEEGVRAALAARPDLVLCDLQMPGMDGFAVLRELRRWPQLAGTAVVAVTAYAMVGDRERILREGFDGYLPKPIDPRTFVPGVEAFLAPVRAGRTVPAPPPHRPPAARQPAAGPSVLVVDNVSANLQLVRSILEPSGYRVRTAASAAEALALARCERPDLVLSDIHMPGAGGYELLAAFRADPRLAQVPVAFLTSTLRLAQERQRVEEGAAVRLIHRPIEPRALLAEVAACLPGATDE